MKHYSFSLWNKALFNLSYFYYKLYIFTEVKKNRRKLALNEIIWLFNKTEDPIHKKSTLNYIETTRGSFYINPDLMSSIIASPAFERRDIDHLIFLVKKLLDQNKKVLFIDVGAFVGTYSVILSKIFKNNKNLKIFAFEPDGFGIENFPLLKKNISINNVKNITVKQVGLGSRKRKINTHHGYINTVPLDSVLSKKIIKDYSTVVIKIDIEGYEEDALRGATQTIKQADEVIALIEDCVDPSIIQYMEKQHFNFLAKLSPYNSFWIKK